MNEMNLFDIQESLLIQFSGLNRVSKTPNNALQDFYDYLLSILNSSFESAFTLNHDVSKYTADYNDNNLDKGLERSVEGKINKDNIKHEQGMSWIIDQDFAHIISKPAKERLNILFSKVFYNSENISNKDYDRIDNKDYDHVEQSINIEIKTVGADITNSHIIDKIRSEDSLNLPDIMSTEENNIENFLKNNIAYELDNIFQSNPFLKEELKKIFGDAHKDVKSDSFESIIDRRSIDKYESVFSTGDTEKSYKNIPVVTEILAKNKVGAYLKDSGKLELFLDKDLSTQKTDFSVSKSLQSLDHALTEQKTYLTNDDKEVLETQFIIKGKDAIYNGIKVDIKDQDKSFFDKELKIHMEPSDIKLKTPGIEDSSGLFDHKNSDGNNNFTFQFINKDTNISDQTLKNRRTFENSSGHIKGEKEMNIQIIGKSKESIEVLTEPEGIGKLNIKLTLQNESINAKIVAFDNIGKEVIERNVLNIINALIKEGLNISGFSVSLRQKKDEQPDFKGEGEDIRSKEIESQNYIKQDAISIFI